MTRQWIKRVSLDPEEQKETNKPCHETTEDFVDLTKEMKKNQVKKVVKGLDLGGGNVLLAVAWVAIEPKLTHMKFP